jgi:hypothetical protein
MGRKDVGRGWEIAKYRVTDHHQSKPQQPVEPVGREEILTGKRANSEVHPVQSTHPPSSQDPYWPIRPACRLNTHYGSTLLAEHVERLIWSERSHNTGQLAVFCANHCLVIIMSEA